MPTEPLGETAGLPPPPDQGRRPLAQQVVLALQGLARRPWWLLAILVMLALPLWWLARPWVAQRVVAFDLRVQQAGPQWAVQWQRRAEGVGNGAWLEFAASGGSEVFEIRPSGRAHEGGRSFEFWLYRVQPAAGGPPVDLRALLQEPGSATLTGSWVLPPPSVPGIVYTGTEPGLLRLSLPAGGVTIAAAKTGTGGEVEFAYADDRRTVDLYAVPDAGFADSFARRGLPTGEWLPVRQVLPNYELSELALRWFDSPNVELALRNVQVRDTLFGRRIAARRGAPTAGAGVQLASVAGPEARFTGSGPRGEVRLPLEEGLCRRTHVVGYLFTLGVLLVVGFGPNLVRRAWRRSPTRLRDLDAIALYVVIAAHAWMAAWAPVMLVPDSIDYIHTPAVFLQTLSLEEVHPARVPGYSLLVAAFVPLFTDFVAAVGWTQAALGVLTAVMARGILRPFLPRPWPTLALLAVGLSPVALAYERILLSECLAGFLAMLAAYLVVRLAVLNQRGRACGWCGWAVAAALGLAAGVGPYVRGNLQLIVLLAPAVLLLVSLRRGRRWRVLGQALLVGVLGVTCLVPWVARNVRLTGRAEFIVGRNYQRVEEAGQLKLQLADDNQTRVFDYEQWRRIRRDLRLAQGYALLQELNSSRLVTPDQAQRSPAAVREELCQPVIEETLARRPWEAVQAMAGAFATQLGLWNKLPQSRAENAYWSAALRGDLRANSAGNTNLMFDLDTLQIAEPTPGWKADMGRRIRHDISYVVESRHARFFSEWFWAGQFIAPAVAVLFLLGMGLTLWRGDYALFGVGLLPLGNAAALTFLVISNVERYSVPFYGLMLVVAVYSAHGLGRWIAARSAPAPVDTRAAGQ